ncbi:uncharacterized protein LOC108049755 [Drosophila rhopaloa]|uniref:Uncharacterized protein LOC108049755 n=1 Tax=Drosophila rhopaloa TaxID=1041015 RepID=A0A6P4FBP5_DRORH|nr:uncharacterized protein LOC108049755 [Drosophila rhopaloa]
MTKDNKKKLLAQRHVYSRMNFLFQASNLMAEGNQAKLAAYYGKVCRNVGTKTVMHMAPALKRSLCRRCSLPLLPGVNAELQVAGEPKHPKGATPPEASSNGEAKTKKKRHRRRRKKPEKSDETKESRTSSGPPETERICLFLECSLCQSRRSFPADNRGDCWLEQPQSVVQVVSLPGENGQR